MKRKTVLKVNIYCHKCRKRVMKAVTKLTGIDKVSVDGVKGTLTVIGDVDPVLITNQVRKIGKVADIISVGHPKTDPPQQNLDPSLPLCCNQCELVGVLGFSSYDVQRMCSIL